MRRRNALAALVVVAVVILVPVSAQGANGHANYHAVCPGPPAGYAHCHVLVVTDSHGNPRAQSAPYGLSPATIKGVYGFSTSSTAGAGKTIAIVDAYDDPNAESDLNMFSSRYSLPPCTTANGCFEKVNQSGRSNHYPRTDSGWALEISLDVQWAHAIAPGAKILLVEARSASLSNLLTAESYATAHADYVSNSWGASEFNSESAYDTYFNGASVFVSSGDNGLPAEWPSSASNVISVGGTTLSLDSSGNLLSETGWSDGGGGCSAYETANPAQSGFSGYDQVHCDGARATPDVSLDADPSSGVSVYDSVSYQGQSGWWKVGGTSASSPMIAARSADQGVAVNAGYLYGNNITFRDITSGSNGAACLVGFDLCSGRGSWTGGSSGGGTTQPSLSISGGSQTVTAGQTSGTMTVGISTAPSSNLTVSLSSTSTGTSSFSPTSVTIPAGSTTSGTFTYTDTKAGTPTLTASAGGATSGSATVTVIAAAPTSISVSPASASVSTGGSQVFTATGTDQYDNPADVSTASWTTDAPGSLSTTSGSSTTFTAGQSPGSGSVTATIGAYSDSAAVTVTGLSSMSVTVAAGTSSKKGPNYHVPLTVTAEDESGNGISGASVNLDVRSGTCTGTVVASGTGTTGTNGQAGFNFKTRQSGDWCAVATVNATGFVAGGNSTTFTTP